MWKVVVLGAVLLLALLATIPPLAGQSLQLPDAPSTHLNKKFLIAHSILAASILFDGEVTHSHYVFSRGCYESSDWYGDQVTSWHTADGSVVKAYTFSRTFYEINGGILAGVTAVDFFLQRRFHHVPVLRDLSYGLPLAFSFPHWHGGATWLARGC